MRWTAHTSDTAIIDTPIFATQFTIVAMRTREAHPCFGVHTCTVLQQQLDNIREPLQTCDVQRQRAWTTIHIKAMPLQQPSCQFDMIDSDTLLQQIVAALIVNGQYVLILEFQVKERKKPTLAKTLWAQSKMVQASYFSDLGQKSFQCLHRDFRVGTQNLEYRVNLINGMFRYFAIAIR